MGSVENLSENIRRLRKQTGLTQEGLAARLYVSGQAVSKWERGESYPEITLLPALADALGVTVDTLLRAPALSAEEIARIVGGAFWDAEKQRPLTPEDIMEALPELEKTVEAHPEVWQLRYTLAQQYFIAAGQNWQEGDEDTALLQYRRILELLKSVRSDPGAEEADVSTLDTMQDIAQYRLGDSDSIQWLQRQRLFGFAAEQNLMSVATGKDFYYLSQHSVFQKLILLSGLIGTMAMSNPKDGEARLYHELPGDEAWQLTPDEKLDTLSVSVKLLEFLSGGKPRGPLLLQIVNNRSLLTLTAAHMGKRELVLEEVAAMRSLCSPELLAEDMAISDAVRKTLFWRMGQSAPDGTPKPETASGVVTLDDAVSALTEEERRLFFTPVSALPCLKYRYVGELEPDYPPLGIIALENVVNILRSIDFEFVRDDPDFQEAVAYFTDASEKAKAKYTRPEK